MGKRKPKRLLSLDEQLVEHDANAPPGPEYGGPYHDSAEGVGLEAPTSERMAWAKKRLELTDAIRRRDAKRMTDDGRQGKFEPSAYAARGHKVAMVPKSLDKSLPRDSQFPKRVTTQRVIDRLKARGTISAAEWLAADKLWGWWCAAETGDRLVAAYEPVTVHSTPNSDRLVTKRLDAANEYLDMINMVPTRCRGVVIHVVINDWELSAWGIKTAKSERARRRQAAKRLTQGLRALAGKLGY